MLYICIVYIRISKYIVDGEGDCERLTRRRLELRDTARRVVREEYYV